MCVCVCTYICVCAVFVCLRVCVCVRVLQPVLVLSEGPGMTVQDLRPHQSRKETLRAEGMVLLRFRRRRFLDVPIGFILSGYDPRRPLLVCLQVSSGRGHRSESLLLHLLELILDLGDFLVTLINGQQEISRRERFRLRARGLVSFLSSACLLLRSFPDFGVHLDLSRHLFVDLLLGGQSHLQAVRQLGLLGIVVRLLLDPILLGLLLFRLLLLLPPFFRLLRLQRVRQCGQFPLCLLSSRPTSRVRLLRPMRCAHYVHRVLQVLYSTRQLLGSLPVGVQFTEFLVGLPDQRQLLHNIVRNRVDAWNQGLERDVAESGSGV